MWSGSVREDGRSARPDGSINQVRSGQRTIVHCTVVGPSRTVRMHGPTGIWQALAANGIAMIMDASTTRLLRRIGSPQRNG